MSGEYAGGGESDGSRRGEYAGAPTTATTTGVRPAAAATLAGEEEAPDDAGLLSFDSATPVSLASSCCCCCSRVGVEAPASTAAPVAATAAAATVAVAAVVLVDAHSCEASLTGGSDGSGGLGDERRLRGEESGDRSKESVLGVLMMETPTRLEPRLVLVLVLLLADIGWPWSLPLPRSPLPLPLPLLLPAAVRAGGTRVAGGSRGKASAEEDWSDPEDSDRSVATMGLVLRTLVVDGKAAADAPAATAAAATPEAPPARPRPPPPPRRRPPVADSAELEPWAESATESSDPGPTCTMTVPSALEETWLPTWLPSANCEEVPASDEEARAAPVGPVVTQDEKDTNQGMDRVMRVSELS